MTALWIVLAVVVVLAIAALVATLLVRRRRAGGTPAAQGRQAAAPTASKPAAPAAPPVARGPPERPVAPAADEPAAAGEPAEAGEPEPEIAEPAGPEAEEPGAPPTFRERLGKARGLLAGYVGEIRSRGRIDQDTWDELEEALIRADVGVAATSAVLDDLRGRVSAGEISGPDELVVALRDELVSILRSTGGDGADARALHFDEEDGVTNVWLFVGVNGVGKTTTVGKVARQERTIGRSVLLAAGDTFRAAAGEQLAQWAERTGAEIVRGAEGGDPSAIVFDGVQRAAARGNDLVLADTAGRLHTKVNLVEELKKIRRVADREPGRVTEVLLVLDATTGQNALAQARQFGEAVDVTGVVLTKLDGTAKGGVVVAIQRELGVPVKLVGLGEGPDDLVPFDPESFVDALFE